MDRTIVKVDLLECLRSIFSPSCFLYRDLLYKIVSCSGLTPEEYKQVFASFYRRHHSVCLFVNEFYFFSPSPDSSLLELVSQDLLDRINTFRKNILKQCDDLGAKYLVETHLYVYLAVNNFAPFADVEGISLCSK